MNKLKTPFRFLIQVPGSSSNLGPGFDVLGMAVNLYVRIRVEPSPHDAHLLTLTGEDSQLLAGEKSNLILEVAQSVARSRRLILPPLKLAIHNEIPLSRGLGSSAAAIIAGISLAELFSPQPFSREEILSYGLQFESHPDNLAACLVGGFTAAKLFTAREAMVLSLPFDRRIRVVAAIPETTVQTHHARRVLPSRYPRCDVITNLQNAVLLSHALRDPEGSCVRRLFEDRLHQPYRARLVPGLEGALRIPDMPGLMGTYLSGSGPTLVALASSHFPSIGKTLQNCFSKGGLSSRMVVLNIDRRGRSVRLLA